MTFPRFGESRTTSLEDLQYYKELDNALFDAGLPHLLDILSVTSLVNAALEADQPAEQLKHYLSSCVDKLYSLKGPPYRGMPASARLLARLMGAITAKTTKPSASA